MRNKDKILEEFVLDDTRIVIVKNSRYHIIRYGSTKLNNFYKKAKRVQHTSLTNMIEWLSNYFGVDITDLNLKIKRSLNRPFKDLKLSRHIPILSTL